MKHQYVIEKYVLASSAKEAIAKARKLPVHNVYVHSGWFEKNANYQFNPPLDATIKGFKDKK